MKEKILPGNLLAWCIREITGMASAQCNRCSHHVRQMNEWGWWKCWRNRDTITDWLIASAAKDGIKVPKDTALSLIVTGFKQFYLHRKTPNNGAQMNETPVDPIVANIMVKAKAGLSILEVNKMMTETLMALEGWEVLTFNVGKRTSQPPPQLPPATIRK